MPKLIVALAAFLTLSLPVLPALAQDDAAASTEDTVTDPALAELLAKEKEARKACKIEICSIMLGKKAEGSDVACGVVKTWPKDDITKMMKRTKVSWPWGNTTCKVEVKLKRQMLVSAMSDPKYEAQFDEHELACEVAREGEEPYSFKIAMTPNITFENGKATEGYITWGALTAPAMAKSVLWPATALDNKVNALGSELVEAVNGFVEKKCPEVKDELKLN